MKLYTKRDWLHEQRVVKKRSLREIAALCGCNHKTILQWCRVFDIEPVRVEETPEYKKFIKEMLENAEKFEGHKFSVREKRSWIKIYHKMWISYKKAKAEKALKKRDPAHAGRVLNNRQTHPGDRIEFGGGQAVLGYYDAKTDGKTFAQEMDELLEIHDKIG